MTGSPRLELISFKLCPFVQRAAIVLLEKGCDFDVTYIDLADKPDWFLEISPMGKVPVLRVDDEVLFESAVIAEYLDETFPPRLHPEDPLQRARNRAWIEFSSEMLMDHFRMLKAADREDFDSRRMRLTEKLDTLERNLGTGPFFNGDNFSLADAAFAPGFMRLAETQRLHPLALLNEFPAIGRWSEALLGRDSVQESVVKDFPELFRAYVKESGSYFSTLID